MLKSNANNESKVPVNTVLTITCSADAMPAAQYVFYRNGAMQQNSSSNIWSTSRLTCPSVSGVDNYSCIAYNVAGSSSKDLSVVIFGKSYAAIRFDLVYSQQFSSGRGCKCGGSINERCLKWGGGH